MLPPLVAWIPAAVAAAVAAAAPMAPLRVHSLAGRRLVLPADLGRPALLIVGFTRESSRQTRPWAERARGDSGLAGIAIEQVAVIAGIPRLFRGLAESQIRSAIPAALHQTFLLADEDQNGWRRLTANADEEAAAVVLIDANGRVVWRAAGALTPASYAALQRAVNALPR